MHLLCMDAGFEPSSPSSLSAEDCFSNSSGLERKGEDEQWGPRSIKRRAKNRDAARKSRRKQTERADELHEELQCLEQSNSAFQKEIAALKKELHLYETALERHKTHCRLSMSASTSLTQPSVSSSASSSLPQASNSPSPSRSTSLNPGMGLQAFNHTEKMHLSPSASSPTTTAAAASSAATSAEIFTASYSSRSSPAIIPHSVSFSTQPAPHSLFSQVSLMTSRGTNAMPVSAKQVPSTAARLQPGTIHQTSSASQGSCFSGDMFLMNLESSRPASTSTQAPFSHAQAKNTSAPPQGCSMSVPQLYSCKFSGNPISSCLQHVLSPSPLQGAVPQTLPLEVSPVPPFASKQSYREQAPASSGSLLSLLTVPSPPVVSQTTSSSFHGPASQPPLSSLSEDSSLSELLEINDWILNGINHS